jgi:hypothetical protein
MITVHAQSIGGTAALVRAPETSGAPGSGRVMLVGASGKGSP